MQYLRLSVLLIVALDCSGLVALCLVLLFRYRRQISLAQKAFIVAFLLLLLLSAAAIDWDIVHDNRLPYAQFPFGLRLALSIPALVLSNFAVVRLLNREQIQRTVKR